MQYGIRCVATSPLVEKPHTAKLENSSQKSSDRAPRTRPDSATTTGLTVLGDDRRFGGRAVRAEPDAAGAFRQHQRHDRDQRQDHQRHQPTARSASRDARPGSPAAAGRQAGRWRCSRSAARPPGRAARRTSGSPPPSPCRPCRRPSRRRPARPRWRRAPTAGVANAAPTAPATSNDSEREHRAAQPIRWISAAPNGPTSPPSRMLSEIAPGDRRRHPSRTPAPAARSARPARRARRQWRG